MTKRRVFISYHHANEQSVVESFSETFSDDYEVFTDKSLERAANSDDVDYLAGVCREAIYGTSVTIVMIGTQTGCRKFVDWEIDYTLKQEHGLLGVSRPGLFYADACLPERLKDNLLSGYSQWYQYPSTASELRSFIEAAYSADRSKIKNDRESIKRNTSC